MKAWKDWEKLYIDGRELTRAERRNAIRQGYLTYQWWGWTKDPPYPHGDPRRDLWLNGVEAAEDAHKGKNNRGTEGAAGWR